MSWPAIRVVHRRGPGAGRPEGLASPHLPSERASAVWREPHAGSPEGATGVQMHLGGPGDPTMLACPPQRVSVSQCWETFPLHSQCDYSVAWSRFLRVPSAGGCGGPFFVLACLSSGFMGFTQSPPPVLLGSHHNSTGPLSWPAAHWCGHSLDSFARSSLSSTLSKLP